MQHTFQNLTCQRLKFARRERKLKSARTFSLKHKIPVNTYLNHISSRRSMKPKILTKYALLLKISLARFISGKEHWDLLNELNIELSSSTKNETKAE